MKIESMISFASFLLFDKPKEPRELINFNSGPPSGLILRSFPQPSQPLSHATTYSRMLGNRLQLVFFGLSYVPIRPIAASFEPAQRFSIIRSQPRCFADCAK
jgi:hypothetical protein